MAAQNVTFGQNHIETLLLTYVRIVDLYQQLLCLLVVPGSNFGLCIIVVECVAVDEEAPN